MVITLCEARVFRLASITSRFLLTTKRQSQLSNSTKSWTHLLEA
jgi:hypothetical protein